MLVPLCDCCERAEAVVDCDSASTGGSPGLKREMRACGRFLRIVPEHGKEAWFDDARCP